MLRAINNISNEQLRTWYEIQGPFLIALPGQHLYNMKKRIKGQNDERREYASKSFESQVYYMEPLKSSDTADTLKFA